MSPRKRKALALRAALTFSCAVLVHGVIHAAGSSSFVWDSPAHMVMLAVTLALLGGIAGPLGLAGPACERRRRLALVRAALPRTRGAELAWVFASQAALAVLLMGAEGTVLDPQRLAVTLVCGIAALVLSALLLAGCERRVVALLQALAATGGRRDRSCVIARRAPRLVQLAAPFRLFVPNRPPPIAA
jgi:hypothetical protein